MRRMISGKAQKYIKDLSTNHPDPSADWGGASYTAGTGIDITNNEISVDNTVATKTFVENYAEPAEYLFELTGDHGQLTAQQIQKLQSLGTDALGKKILIRTGVEDVVVILDTMFKASPIDPNAYTYVGRNCVSVGYDGSATWYGVTVFSNFWINSDFENPYTWGLGNEQIDLLLKSTDFVKDPYTGEIGISSSIARVNDIPAVPTTTDGTYVLKATVSSGVVTYAWVLEV